MVRTQDARGHGGVVDSATRSLGDDTMTNRIHTTTRWPLNRVARMQLARTDLCFVEALCNIECGETKEELESLTRIHREAAAVLLEAQGGR